MNSQQLLYFNIIVGLLLVAYFLFGRKKQDEPTRLNLKAASKADAQAEPSPDESANGSPKMAVLAPEKEYTRTKGTYDPGPLQVKTKNLSIFFMYNGHDWEAHDVLGIPQGASLHNATQAYQALIKTADPSAFEFLEAAYNAIFLKRTKEGL